MPVRIAIITTEFLRDFLESALVDMDLDMEYALYPYAHFGQIAQIYAALPQDVQGVVTSGVFPQRIIQKSHPGSRRVIHPFHNDDAGLYKLFLQLLYRERTLDASRIYADVLEFAGIDLADYLFGQPRGPYTELLEQNLRDMSLEELVAREEATAKEHLRLWREGKIDVSVTRFSSIVQRLKDAGVNVHFAYPSRDYLRAVLQRTLQDVRIQEMRDNQTATIAVQLVPPDGDDESKILLRKAIVRFLKSRGMESVIHPMYGGFEILTSRAVVEALTHGQQLCSLQAFLCLQPGFASAVGYGIGQDMYKARAGARDAVREAQRLGQSCLVNEWDEMIAPLRDKEALVVSRNASGAVRRMAKKAGLSSYTVQKVLAAAQDVPGGRITAAELARKLSVTTRSANRFLRALSDAGYAKVVGHSKGTTMGRPQQVYQVEAG